MSEKDLPVADAATAVTGSAPLSAAERQRRHRARQRAAREAERIEAEAAPLRILLADQAGRDLALIEQHLDEGQQGLALAERTLEGAKAVILRLSGHPLLRLAETALLPVELLANRLVCTRLEAAKLQQDAQRELLDRLHGKAPAAKGDGAAPPIAIQLNVTPEVARHLQIQADQALSEGEQA
jgi:hypothetical protein